MKVVQIDLTKLDLAAGKLKAMSHPMRIAIINLLTINKNLTVTEIFQKLDIEQASASHHLNILKNKGIVTARRDGKRIFYALKNKHLTEIIACINKCTED